jgi:acetyl-CoA carboxylase, biotin carboxylase subunit
MISKLLIANRGEIAVLIIRACRELDIRTVAVFSEADRAALHVRLAEEAYPLGPTPSAESYLRIDKLLAVARQSGAQAVHPGYGFLSENAEFAAACEQAGLLFIGPSSRAIRALGSKSAGRRLAESIGVSVVPGGRADTDEEAEQSARALGFPLFVKAVAGGGGKGMRLVERAADLGSALRTARAEGQKAFGNGTVYLERRLPAPRHIEVQVLADSHGTVLALGERDCSVQRRHQKVLEEAPAPHLDPSLRERLHDAAVQLARAAGYVNAGTMEFLVDAERRFYFLEANTRLQVEHPITELVTGLDLVQLQIRIAAGEPLTLTADQYAPHGAALECRIYAEDPFQQFAPGPGTITGLREPGGPGVRVDSGVYEGWTVPAAYDALIAKISTWGRDRAQAIRRMGRALREYHVQGIPTTIPFHRQVLVEESFLAGGVDTTYLDRRFPDRPHAWSEAERAVAVVAAAVHASRRRPVAPAAISGPGISPWVLAARQAALRRG